MFIRFWRFLFFGLVKKPLAKEETNKRGKKVFSTLIFFSERPILCKAFTFFFLGNLKSIF